MKNFIVVKIFECRVEEVVGVFDNLKKAQLALRDIRKDFDAEDILEVDWDSFQFEDCFWKVGGYQIVEVECTKKK